MLTYPSDTSVTDKREKLARKLYQTFVDTSDEVIARTWDYLDADEKFNWIAIADTALEEIRTFESFQKAAIVEAYRERGLFSVPHGQSFDDALCDFFEHGWINAFDSYYDVPDEASNGFS